MIRGMQDKAAPDATACPLIGLARDCWTRFQFPDQAHRCWARNPPKKIDLHFQGAICLGPDFRDCVWYGKWEKIRSESGS
jgi:hypothetical protein